MPYQFCKILSNEGEAKTAVKFPFKLSRVGHLARMFLSLPPPWVQPEAETSQVCEEFLPAPQHPSRCLVSTPEARPRLSSHSSSARPYPLPAQVGFLASKPPAVHPQVTRNQNISLFHSQAAWSNQFQVFGRFNRFKLMYSMCSWY